MKHISLSLSKLSKRIPTLNPTGQPKYGPLGKNPQLVENGSDRDKYDSAKAYLQDLQECTASGCLPKLLTPDDVKQFSLSKRVKQLINKKAREKGIDHHKKVEQLGIDRKKEKTLDAINILKQSASAKNNTAVRLMLNTLAEHVDAANNQGDWQGVSQDIYVALNFLEKSELKLASQANNVSEFKKIIEPA